MLLQTAGRKVELIKEHFSKYYSEKETTDYHKILHSLEYVENDLCALQEQLESRQKEVELLRLHLNPKKHFGFLSSKNKAMQSLFTIAEKNKQWGTLLILGEKGTGKESLARVIHVHSEKKGPFLVYDQSDGEILRYATRGYAQDDSQPHNSTLYFPEVSLTTPHLQKKLLEWADDAITKEVPRLIISARQVTDLEPEVVKKIRFIPLSIPPLRERKEDILPMIDFFVREFTRNEKSLLNFSPFALNKLVEYPWPGNISELKLEIKKMLSDHKDKKKFTINLLPEKMVGSSLKEFFSIIKNHKSLSAALQALERKMVTEALIQYQGNKSKVSRELGISRSGLSQKIQKYGIRGV